jgi:hypothetical protein
MPDTGTFTNRPRLVHGDLAALVRKQRTHAKRVAKADAAVAKDRELEKEQRAKIDALLIADGFTKGEVVTCNGYDVRHNERDGQTWINPDTLTELLVADGVDRDLLTARVTASTEHGDVVKFATVTPSKGAKVRV